jgi:N-acetylglucosamine kinase-like BadF-type ATPase
MHVLGIDVGGSKTVCLLADELGAVRAEVRGPGANLQAAGELQVEEDRYRVMEEALVDRERRR